jgi:hypothetical protein
MLRSLRDFSVPPDGFMIVAVPQLTPLLRRKGHSDFNPPRSTPISTTQSKLPAQLYTARLGFDGDMDAISRRVRHSGDFGGGA